MGWIQNKLFSNSSLVGEVVFYGFQRRKKETSQVLSTSRLKVFADLRARLVLIFTRSASVIMCFYHVSFYFCANQRARDASRGLPQQTTNILLNSERAIKRRSTALRYGCSRRSEVCRANRYRCLHFPFELRKSDLVREYVQHV